jgi:hypothetical protein
MFIIWLASLDFLVVAQELRVRAQGVAREALNDNNLPNKIDRNTALAQVRGLVQNELRIVGQICRPTEQQSKVLLSLIEEEWKPKSAREVAKRLQPHVHGTIDFDGVVERSMQAWVAKALTSEQTIKYEQELSERLLVRREALVEQMLVWLHDKLQLSSRQQEAVRKVLEEKWKDRWYRSVEGVYDNETLLPELNRSWLDTILTEAQRNALAIRTPISRAPVSSLEYPIHPLDAPLRLGDAESVVRAVSESTVVPAEPPE